MSNKYWEYTNSDTGFFCFAFGFAGVLLTIGAFTDSIKAGLICSVIPLILFTCGIIWVIRYKKFRKLYKEDEL